MSYKTHWQSQRLTALLLVLIYPCLIAVFYNLRHASYGEIIQAFSNPFFVTLIFVAVIAALYHAILGLQVIIEDYVKNLALRNTVLVILRMAGIIVFVFTIISIVKLIILGTQL